MKQACYSPQASGTDPWGLRAETPAAGDKRTDSCPAQDQYEIQGPGALHSPGICSEVQGADPLCSDMSHAHPGSSARFGGGVSQLFTELWEPEKRQTRDLSTCLIFWILFGRCEIITRHVRWFCSSLPRSGERYDPETSEVATIWLGKLIPRGLVSTAKRTISG